MNDPGRGGDKAAEIAAVLADVVYAVQLEPEFVFEYVSPSVEQLVGYSPAEHYADPALGTKLLDPRDGPVMAQAIDADIGAIVDLTVRWLRKDGREVWTQHRCSKSRRDDGSVVLYGAARDVTAQNRAEEQLIQSEANYRLLADNSADLLVLIDSEQGPTWVSPSIQRVLGYEPEDVLAGKWFELIHPDDTEPSLEVFRQMWAGHEDVVSIELRLRARDGSYKWWRATARRTADGLLQTRVVMALQDIDAQVLTRAEARRQGDLRAAALESMLDPHVLLAVIRDGDGAIVDFESQDVNDAACVYAQKDRDAMLGDRLWGTPPVSEAAAYLKARCAHAVETGTPLVLDDFEFQPEGLDETRRLDIRAVKVGDALSLSWRDVTEKYRSAGRLRDAEQSFRLLAENASDVVFRADPTTRIEWVSPSVVDVLGWTPEELIGRPAKELTHPEDQGPLAGASNQVNRGHDAAYEGRFRAADGTWLWMSVQVRPILGENGDVIGRVAALRDVDAEHAARQELARSQQILAATMQSAPVGMARLDLQRRFVQVNPALCRLLDRDESWLLGHAIDDLLDAPDMIIDRKLRADLHLGSIPSAMQEHQMIRSDGSRIWVLHSMGMLRDQDGRPTGQVSQFVDLTEAHETREQLRLLATHDPLTGLVNRRELVTRIEGMLSRTPGMGTSVGLLFADLDQMKSVNDTYGHQCGDIVLVEVAARIQQAVRTRDVVARFGGDEYVIALPSVGTLEETLSVAHSIQASVAGPIAVGDGMVTATLSIGVTLAHAGEDLDDVLKRADVALYRAKEQGRGVTCGEG